MMGRILLASVLVACSWSCTQIEYDVLEPALPRMRVAAKESLWLNQDPVRYQFQTVENRLVVRVFNNSPTPMVILGSRSSVTDPTGQARPIRSQPIPPGAFVKFVLPPVRPEFVGRGGGSRLSHAYGPGLGREEFGFGQDEPASYTLRDGGEFYWDWEGETQARMTLVIEHEGKELKQEFVFGRRKAD